MLFVLEPISNVSCAVGVLICSLSMRFVVEPHSFINIAISMHQGSKTIGLVVLPLALVSGGVRPDLDAVTVLLSVDSLASEHASISI